MKNKLATIKYLPNNFKIIEDGDHVICAISGKKIYLDKLTYWNVELQEAYFSYSCNQQSRWVLISLNFFSDLEHSHRNLILAN